MDLTISFEYNKVEENLESIISIKDKQLKIDSSFLEKDAKKYAFLNINIWRFSSSIKGFCIIRWPNLLLSSSVFLLINLNISKTFLMTSSYFSFFSTSKLVK